MLLSRVRDVLVPLLRFDVVEAIKTVVIWIVGAIYVALMACIVIAGIWVYATSKGVT